MLKDPIVSSSTTKPHNIHSVTWRLEYDHPKVPVVLNRSNWQSVNSGIKKNQYSVIWIVPLHYQISPCCILAQHTHLWCVDIAYMRIFKHVLIFCVDSSFRLFSLLPISPILAELPWFWFEAWLSLLHLREYFKNQDLVLSLCQQSSFLQFLSCILISGPVIEDRVGKCRWREMSTMVLNGDAGWRHSMSPAFDVAW